MLLCRKDFFATFKYSGYHKNITMDVLSFFFRFGIHLQLNLMRKAFKQLTTEACLKPLTLCRYFFKSPKPKRAETSISYLISSELKEQSYTACYLLSTLLYSMLFFLKNTFFPAVSPFCQERIFFSGKIPCRSHYISHGRTFSPN